jgi:hypothetical protein
MPHKAKPDNANNAQSRFEAGMAVVAATAMAQCPSTNIGLHQCPDETCPKHAAVHAFKVIRKLYEDVVRIYDLVERRAWQMQFRFDGLHRNNHIPEELKVARALLTKLELSLQDARRTGRALRWRRSHL